MKSPCTDLLSLYDQTLPGILLLDQSCMSLCPGLALQELSGARKVSQPLY